MSDSMNDTVGDEVTLDAFHCPDCGYHLRGLSASRCPECGYSMDGVRTATESGIPWVHRREIGTLRAYWQTVCSVSFRHKRFCDEMARPVSYADAQGFRWMTILHVYLSLIALSVFFYVVGSPDLWTGGVGELLRNYWLFVVPQVFGLPLLVAVTGIPSYFFHPKSLDTELQNRAIALSYYSVAVLTWVSVVGALVILGWVLAMGSEAGAVAVIVCAVCVLFGLVAIWWLDLLHIARRTMPHLRQRVQLIGICVPVLWSLTAIVTLGLLPLIAIYIFVAIESIS